LRTYKNHIQAGLVVLADNGIKLMESDTRLVNAGLAEEMGHKKQCQALARIGEVLVRHHIPYGNFYIQHAQEAGEIPPRPGVTKGSGNRHRPGPSPSPSPPAVNPVNIGLSEGGRLAITDIRDLESFRSSSR
jgi:hypothetical protein